MFKGIRLLILPLLLLIAGAGAVHAHAVVTGADPPDGVVLADAPPEVIVRFNEPVSLVRAQILDPAGRDVLVSDGTRSDDGELRLGLPASLVEGTYTVSYHVMSLDGHPVAGSMIFSFGKISGQVAGEQAARAPGEQAASEPSVWRYAFLAIRVALYFGMFGAVGGVALLLVAKPSDHLRHATRRIIAVSSVTGVTAALIGLGLQGGMLLGGPPGFLLDAETWLIGAKSPFGRTAISAIMGFALIWIAVRTARSAITLSISAVGSILVLASFALSGHVVTAGPPKLTVPPLLLHVAIAAFWVGSL
ncbi:copper resistance protein CopC/CopD, partial [Nitratireductor sp. L1-7-SE]